MQSNVCFGNSSLIAKAQQFFLELGQRFAFVCHQVHMEIGESDLLFYHLKLRCYVAIELK